MPLKRDLIYRHSWPTTAAARNAIAEYIEIFYNVRRRHSANGMVSPAEFERRHHDPRAAQAA
ncbi:MAG: IS3 family transposase [Deltaproteobacteria bacterium]|nr:IS3 family transposase [Deltaproteobacteria bacterium]